ncbi:hypothetical protein ILYODFUR_006076 [Ilyodon furcidens]|uniref:Uncharacterized protein n=1 Tax=Ilyodon furcidens TaxID=33524 RepID=A0ABV0SUL2_9TELE
MCRKIQTSPQEFICQIKSSSSCSKHLFGVIFLQQLFSFISLYNQASIHDLQIQITDNRCSSSELQPAEGESCIAGRLVLFWMQQNLLPDSNSKWRTCDESL